MVGTLLWHYSYEMPKLWNAGFRILVILCGTRRSRLARDPSAREARRRGRPLDVSPRRFHMLAAGVSQLPDITDCWRLPTPILSCCLPWPARGCAEVRPANNCMCCLQWPSAEKARRLNVGYVPSAVPTPGPSRSAESAPPTGPSRSAESAPAAVPPPISHPRMCRAQLKPQPQARLRRLNQPRG